MKFTCPGCGRSVRGKPDTAVGCKPCGYLDMLPERPADQSSDQRLRGSRVEGATMTTAELIAVRRAMLASFERALAT